MTPEDRLRALKNSDRWTVNALEPRKNPFGESKPAGRRQSLRMIIAEVAVVAAVAGIVFGAIALTNRAPNEVATTPTPTPTISAGVPLISGTITKSTGERWESGVPIELLVWPAVETDRMTLDVVASAVTGENGTFAFTIADVSSLQEYAKSGNIVDFEIRGFLGKEMATWSVSRALENVDGVLSVIDASWESFTPADWKEQARTGITGLNLTSLYNEAIPDESTPAPPPRIVLSTEGVQLIGPSNQDFGKYFYFEEDGDEIVAALTQAFGVEPEVTTFEYSSEIREGRLFSWEGVDLYVNDGEIRRDIGNPRFRLVVSAEEVNGMAIRTTRGLMVGSPIDDVAAQADNTTTLSVANGFELDAIMYHLDEQVVPDFAGTDIEGDPVAWSTLIVVPDGETTVKEITVPHTSFRP